MVVNYRKLICVAYVVPSGCSDLKVAPVSGTITLDGQPLANASVTFHPQGGGRPSYGVTDENGNYRLGYSMHEEGAEVGSCTVNISTALEQGDYGSPVAKEKVPARHLKEPPVVEVQSRSNTIDIELTSTL